jgi:hypothetical protein
MEVYVASYGRNHIIEPIGYHTVRKVLRRGAIARSMTEQYAIHTLAYQFQSSVIHIPKPDCLESPVSYTMEEVYAHMLLPTDMYPKIPELFVALLEFQQYMVGQGYWAYGYNVLVSMGKFYIVDFSQFGSIDGNYVRFPKNKTIHRLSDLQTYFDLQLTVDPTAPDAEVEKIDAPFSMDPDVSVVFT